MTISYAEVTAVFKDFLDGKISCPETFHDLKFWRGVTEPTIVIGDWEFVFFIEAEFIYDVYEAEAPDGRIFDFHEAERSSGMENFLNDDDAIKMAVLLGCPPH